jgi:hypothetical protein
MYSGANIGIQASRGRMCVGWGLGCGLGCGLASALHEVLDSNRSMHHTLFWRFGGVKCRLVLFRQLVLAVAELVAALRVPLFVPADHA